MLTRTLILTGFVMVSATAMANVTAYTDGSVKLYVDVKSDDTAYLKIDGAKSPWDGKVIKTKRTRKASGDERFAFDYFLELSSGKVKKTYVPVVSGDKTLVNGTIVKTVELHYPSGPREGVNLKEDAGLAGSVKSLDLETEYKAHPFSPQLDQ